MVTGEPREPQHGEGCGPRGRERRPGRDHGIQQMFFGGVGAAYRREDGVLQAAGDPRREAAVAVFDVP